jgi:hypothetical protein
LANTANQAQNAPGGGCQGENLDRTKQLVESFVLQAVEAFQLGGIGKYIEVLQQAQSEAEQLPQACQVTIEEWAGAISTTNGKFETQCHGDVCCSSSECL